LSSELNQNNDQLPVEQKQDTKEYNFSQIRKQLESERQEKQKLADKIAELERGLQERPKIAEGEDEGYDEPYIDEKRLNRRLARFEEKFDKRVHEVAEQKARSLLEQERQQNFIKQSPDFHEILKPEFIQKFADKYPEIAEQMLEMPDNFARQKLLYQNIKAFGIHKKEEPQPSIQQKIDANRRSPFYQPSGIGTAPYSGGGDFSETGQKSSYNKMKELQKNMRL